MEKNQYQLSDLQVKEIGPVVTLLVAQYQPDKIICFGCVSNNREAAGCFMGSESRFKSHYFLLMITKEAFRVEHDAQDYVNTHFGGGTISIISHGRKIIEQAIVKNSRFFITVYRDGCLLYTADGMPRSFEQLTLPEIDPIQTQTKAKKHYNSRWTMACGFLEAAAKCNEEAFYNNTVFLLHQAVEQTCIALIRVCTGYRPDLHNLDRLLKLCLCFCPDLSIHFQLNTEEEIRLFQVLNAGYSDVRYKDDFNVSAEDAGILMNQVDEFMVMAGVICQNKIEAYETLANLPHEHVMDYTPALTALILDS